MKKKAQAGFDFIFVWISILLVLAAFIGIINAGVNAAGIYFDDGEIVKYLLYGIPVLIVLAFLISPINQIFLRSKA